MSGNTSSNYEIDTVRPTLDSISLGLYEFTYEDNSTTITFTFNEAVSGFTEADVTSPNGSLSSFTVTGDPKVYTATFTADEDVDDSTNVITVGTGWTDLAGNSPLSGNTSANYVVNTSAIGPTPRNGEIWFLEHLAYINTDSITLSDSYVLMRDLDFNDSNSYYSGTVNTSWTTGNGWDPIGNSSNKFTGELDGNNHTISNLYANRTSTYYQSLIGYADGAIISDITLEDVNVSGRWYIGGLVGYNYNSLVSKSSVTGSVSGDSKVGGLVGYNYYYSEIRNSHFRGVVSGGDNIGGLVGYNYKYSQISHCYSTGFVSSSGSYIGGLVAYNRDSTIYDSYSTSSISGDGTTVGGLSGYNYNSTITNCYSVGGVSKSPDGGGLLGYVSSTTVNNCYWNIETSGQSTSAGGTGKTTSEMTKSSTFSSWNFIDVWNITEDSTYPYLRINEQTPPPVPASTVSSDVLPGEYFVLSLDISLSSYPSGDIYYTTDNTNPSCSGAGTLYNSSITITTGETTIKAISCVAGYDAFVHTFNYVLPEPTIILNASDLYNVRNDLSGFYALGADIDLGVSPYNTGEGWVPIGNNSTKFTGIFDGGGYKINNLYINRPSTDYQGLFGYTSLAKINNFGLEDINVSGSNQIGGLVGYSLYSDITNIYSTGSVSGNYYVGGLVGNSYNNSIIDNCYSESSILGSSYIGGLVGYNYSSDVFNSYSKGSVSGGGYLGGLIGYNTNNSITDYCYSTSSVSGSDNYVGGLVGRNNATVSNSYWDTETSGQSTSDGGTGKTTSEMKQQSTFTGWDFTDIWSILEDYTTPYLKNLPSQELNQTPVSGEIWFLEHLAYIDTNATTLSDSYTLMRDLDFNDPSSYYSGTVNTSWTTGDGWVPIGDNTTQFTGDFNGNNHIINNLYINLSSGRVGLFGYINGASVFNTGLENVDVSGTHVIGSLVGYNYDSNVENCYSIGDVSGTEEVGGLVGNSSTNSNIINSYSEGTVSASIGVGGGLVGSHGTGSFIKESYSKSVVSGGYYVGGLVGDNWGSSIVENSYAVGSVSGSSAVGGLVGNNWWSGVVENSYSVGSVSGSSEIGGLVGVNLATVTNSYWDTQTSGQSTSAGGTGKTTAEMKTQATFTPEWDFTSIWTIYPSESYPYLKNLEPSMPPGIGDIPVSGHVWYLEHLEFININAETLSVSYTLMRDLDFNDPSSYYSGTVNTSWTTGDGWVPIGNSSTEFTGDFNGNSYTISNLYINRSLTDYVGLFGYIKSNSQINNIYLEDVNVTGNTYVGGLSGRLRDSTASGSYVSGSVSGSGGYVGGLFGYSDYYSGITDSNTNVSVSGTTRVGGLIGSFNDSELSYCNSEGSVLGSSDYVGGLIGYNSNSDVNYSSSSSNAESTGDYVGGLAGYNYYDAIIYSGYAEGYVSGVNRVGGLVGNNSGSSFIKKSYSTGDVYGTGERVGGLVGYNSNSEIYNSYSASDVSGTINQVGGLVGYNYYNAVISNSYSVGVVSGTGSYVGGLVGDSSSSDEISSYWDTQTSGQSTSAGGTGKTTSEMKTQTTFTGWDFTDVWNITESTTYPYLRENIQDPLPQ